MPYHIRIRPTALIIRDGSILLCEYTDEEGVHYNLPGGGAEPGETVIEAVKREAREELAADVEVGPLAFVYECAPHRQSGDYPDAPHSLNLIFECSLANGGAPRLPDQPDPMQSGVKWIPLNELDPILLFPNIKKQLMEYASGIRAFGLIEDHALEPYFPQAGKPDSLQREASR
ncbi:NUDIX domain-containing protein [Paenibacillus sp. MBLB4367]|uniref:NUDIX domain-containing protein n=1 Tax=Paenibacillus sp. MBLB4367 TaxID=3384767 RepID=UPI0039080785